MNDKCVIMSVDEIERTFRMIERKIALHERDVVVLEARSGAMNEWWMEQQSAEELENEDYHWRYRLHNTVKPIPASELLTISEIIRAATAPGAALEDRSHDSIWAKTLEAAARMDREYRKFAEEQGKVEAPGIVKEATRGEDEGDNTRNNVKA